MRRRGRKKKRREERRDEGERVGMAGERIRGSSESNECTKDKEGNPQLRGNGIVTPLPQYVTGSEISALTDLVKTFNSNVHTVGTWKWPETSLLVKV